jgi:hypothetical protein
VSAGQKVSDSGVESARIRQLAYIHKEGKPAQSVLPNLMNFWRLFGF